LITGVLKSHPQVEQYPEPGVLLDGFGDSSVDFRCLIWTSDIDHWLRIKRELSTQIYNALNDAKITIPFPQRDLHIVSWTTQQNSNVEIPTSETGADNQHQDG
jgi:potassium efflux system protein